MQIFSTSLGSVAAVHRSELAGVWTGTISSPSSDGVRMFLNAVAYAISKGPEFHITAISRAGSDVTLTWDSHTGDTYTIQQSTDIKDPQAWTDIAVGIVGDVGNQTSAIVTALAGNAPVFYRIKKQ